MASPGPLDMNEFTAKERKAAKKELLRKIEVYNRHMRRTKEPSFPLSSPTPDLVYKGVVKFSYDRGYAVQTKSMLVGSDMSTDEVIDQLIDSLGLTGDVRDYELREINHMTQEARSIGKQESPLDIQLQYGPHTSVLELRLAKIRGNHIPRSNNHGHHHTQSSDDEDDEVDGLEDRRNIIPKDEVIDHGFANIEITMEEALEDIPSLVHDVQEKLRLLCDVVSVPQTSLPPRRALWDKLKPQVSALVKNIRHLVDSGEFLATRHCPSNECRLIMTLLLELITDYSRELIVVSKELCGLRGVARTDFTPSLNSFTQQVSHISRLVGKTYDSLHAVALSGHLLHATAPENFIKGPLQNETYFTGSGGISGILIFTITTAYLGLIRGAYEDKMDYYASLASNMLQSGNKALETIQKTKEFGLLHLHPLRSRVVDMEHKLKVAMDTLVKRVKAATSRRPSPVSVPEMLLAGHSLIVATLDFLMVAQCASLLHNMIIEGWEVLDLPWVKGWVSSSAKDHIKPQLDSDSTQVQSTSYMTEQVSSSSDTATERSYGTASTASSGRRRSRERKSRIPTHRRESGDGMDADELAQTKEARVNFGKLTLQPGNLPLHYAGGESGEDADDEGGGESSHKTSSANDPRSETEDEFRSRSESMTKSLVAQSPAKSLPSNLFEKDSTQYMGNAIKRLKQHHTLNMAIARGAEGLLLSLTQKINLLSRSTQEKAKDSYAATVEEIISIAKQIRDEVSSMECEVVNCRSMEKSLENSKFNLQTSVRDTYLSLSFASSPSATDRDRARLVASVSHIQEISSKTIGDALNAVKEHKKALAQAERLELEFVALVTGKNSVTESVVSTTSSSPAKSRRKLSFSTKLQSDSEAESVVIESTPPKTFSPSISWSAKATPKVVGGTKTQLMQRLTYHRALDPVFVETFMLSFHRFVPAIELLQSLVEKFCLNVPRDLDSDSDREAFQSEVAIPARLRAVHALRLWLQYHPKDFEEDSQLGQMLETFLQLIEETMTAGSRQLRSLLKEEHLVSKTHRITPRPILPLEPENEGKFDILDCNSLELARQLCIFYSNAFARIRLKEFLTLGWEPQDSEEKGDDEEKKETSKQLIPDITRAKLISQQLARFVTRRLLLETSEDHQVIVVSYFIKAAESCLGLRNFEAAQALYKGLTSDSVRGAMGGAWRLLSEGELQTFRTLRDFVSPDMNYHRYRMELKKTEQMPCVPLLDALLQDISVVHRNNPDFVPGKPDTLNFLKWRYFAKVLINFHQYRTCPYVLTSIQVVLSFFNKFENLITDKEWIEFV